MPRYINFLLLLFFISCSTNKSKLSENNFFNKNYFYNDSLKVGIDFDKKIQFRDASLVKEKQYKQLLKSNKNLSSKDLFLVADSKENGIEMYFFYQNVQPSNINLINARIVATDCVKNTLFFEKQKDKRKIIGVVKKNLKMDDDFLLVVNDLMNKVTIDSLSQRKLSFPSIFVNYFPSTHPNPLYASKKLATAPLKSEGENSAKFQFLSTVNSFMTNNKKYDSLIGGYEKKRKEEFSPLMVGLSKKDEIFKDNALFDKLFQLAKDNKVIMLNEDHYYPKHRLFAMELLVTLKANGYNYLSLEGFNVSTENEYTPNYNNGLYTSEPYFAHFIRKAKLLGFTVLGHENVDKSSEREIGQAKNILKILDKDPNAKIFVYVGHSHLEKKSENKKWMAEYFKELSGINPVTINQAEICAEIEQELILIPRKYLNDTTKTKSSADYFLINNLKPSLKNIYPLAVFRETKIKSAEFLEYKNEEILVEVIDSKEFDLLKNRAIPIESFLAIPKGKDINFELPIGKYHIFVKTDNDKTIYDNDIIVN